MIQAKTFPLDNYQEFNDFVKHTRPRGENGIRITNTHIVVVYEDGEPMDALDQIASLNFDIGRHKEQRKSNLKQAYLAKMQMKMAKKRNADFIKKAEKATGKEKYEFERLIKDGETIISGYEQKIAADEGAAAIEEVNAESIRELIKDLQK
jgi:hypothetical protein